MSSTGPTSPWRRSRVGCARLARLAVGLAVAQALLGCAATAPRTEEPPDGGRGAQDRWMCESLEGDITEPWYGGFKTWEEDGGVMSSVHGTPWGHGGEYGRPTEEAAVRDALASAAAAAVDLLERRGLSYGRDRRAEIEDRAVETLLEGEEPAFPRVRLGGKIVERCRDEETGASSWRARILAEYPIGHLKGDVANATWERERLLREVEVLRTSAAAHFTEGRWLDGQLDLEHALDLLSESGTSMRDTLVRAEPTPAWGSPDATQAERVLWHLREIRSTYAGLSIEPLGGIEVVEFGAQVGAETAFQVTCNWEGGATPAVGVPMRYEVAGDVAAILDGDPVTDKDGIARCRILRAYGSPGEYEVVAAVDADLVRGAGIHTFGDVVIETSHPNGNRTFYEGGPAASQTFFVVTGGHGVSICAEISGERDRDASQARAGFVQRMANDGYRTETCDPDVDVVVSGNVRLVTVVVPGSWTAEVTIEGTAFDQRSAREIAQTAITVAETSTEGQRDAELRALRESGRLLAVYLSRRILTSGE